MYVRNFHNFIIKKSYMRPILGYSGRDCVLINFFQLYALGLSFFKLIYSGWINMTLPPSTFILEEELIQY